MQPTDTSYTAPPFPPFPSASRYVPVGSVQEAMGRVCRSVDAHEAISLVIGPPGTGKSLICGLLVKHYSMSHEVVVLGETPIENRAAFLRHLLHHLGADFASTPDNDLHLALVDRVCDVDSPPGGLLIVVDEAQSISAEVLESIRMVTNITRKGEPRVSAVVCGGVKLDEILIDTALEAFTQRIATRCYLHPMNTDESRRYIRDTIRICGADPDDTITSESIAAIHHACSGVPRLINQLMTQAIDCAEEIGQALISESIIDRAWATLQQLPGPMMEEPKLTRAGDAPIEFGELGEITPRAEKHHAHDNEIEVEPSTAIWLDEPAPLEPETCDSSAPDVAETIQAAPNTPPASVLFGDFDHEEEVSVGTGTATRPAEHIDPAPQDLESMLHEEIIGMSHYDESIMLAASTFTGPNDADDSDVDALRPDMDGLHEIVEDNQSTLPMDQRLQIASDLDDDIQISPDDSDMLVIEDEVDLSNDNKPTRSQLKQQTVSIDFQSMLARMRTGS